STMTTSRSSRTTPTVIGARTALARKRGSGPRADDSKAGRPVGPGLFDRGKALQRIAESSIVTCDGYFPRARSTHHHNGGTSGCCGPRARSYIYRIDEGGTESRVRRWRQRLHPLVHQ